MPYLESGFLTENNNFCKYSHKTDKIKKYSGKILKNFIRVLNLLV